MEPCFFIKIEDSDVRFWCSLERSILIFDERSCPLEDPLRARFILALFALSAALVACLTTTPLSTQSISGLVSLNANQASGATQASGFSADLAGMAPASSTGNAAFADIIPGRVLVKFKSGLRSQSFGPLSARVAGRSVLLETQRSLGLPGVRLMQVSGMDAKGTLELVAQLAARSDVVYAEPDRRIRSLLTPNDTNFKDQWALGASANGRLNMPDAWSVTTGSSVTGPNPVIAVIDSGVMLKHPDLASKILPGYDFISDAGVAADNDPPDAGNSRDANPDDPGDDEKSYHGTHVSGIAAAIGNNRLGVAGVSWGARILPARILGIGGGAVSDMIDAVLWAAGIDSDTNTYPHNPNKADVINLSVGGNGTCSSAEQEAFNRVIASGTAVVIAAGNENVDAWTTDPASCAGPIVVGAVGRDGTRASYSNYGSRISIVAPGGDKNPGGGILSTIKDATGKAGYGYKLGTSMAAPHVAGVIALMRSLRPNLTPGQLEDLLDVEADPVNCSGRVGCGLGLVDAGAALRFVRASSSVPKADFSLFPDRSVLVLPNATVTMSLNVHAVAFNGFSSPIGLSVQTTGGITAQLTSPNLIADGLGGQGVTLTLDMSRAAAGAHVVRLIGTAAGVKRTVPLFIPISLSGTLVQACYLTTDGKCDEVKSITSTLNSNDSSTSAPYEIDNLKAGEYQMLAWKDLNNDEIINAGDLYGESSLRVTPPVKDIGIALERLAVNASGPFKFNRGIKPR
jgi:serine protease